MKRRQRRGRGQSSITSRAYAAAGYAPNVPLRFETLEDRQLLSAVTGRHLFYNDSSFDGNDPAIDGATDDAAIATDKTPYRPDAVFDINRITTNSVVDSDPRVYGQLVVWQGRGGPGTATDDEIFLYDGTTITQLTDNAVPDRFPEISALGIIWERGSGTTQEIIYHDGVSETPLTSNAVLDGSAVLSDDRVVWESGSGNGIEMMSWDGTLPAASNIVNLSNNAVVDRFAGLDGDNAVWIQGSTPTARIVRSDAGGAPGEVGSQTSTFALGDPQLSGAKVVWEGFRFSSANGSGREIYMYDGSTIVDLTDNDFPDFDPQIDGDNVVWWGGVFNDFQVSLYDSSTATEISTGLRNQFPKIDGTNVVWVGFDGNDDEIMWWNGQEVIQVTDNTIGDTNVQIDGNHIVWQAQTGLDGLSLEIYEAYLGNSPSDFINVSSYSRGINGIMVDIAGHLTLTVDDFLFKVGNNNSPSSWAAAPDPSAFSVRSNFDGSGTSRVEITWADNAIENEWLEVQVLPTANTGLAEADVFYWGSKIGDIGNPTATSFTTTAAGDANPIISGGLGPAGGITNVRDIDRSNVITAAGDRGAAIGNIGAITRLHLTSIAPPPLLVGSSESAAAGIASALTAAQEKPTPAPGLVPTSAAPRIEASRSKPAAAATAEAIAPAQSGADLDDEGWELDEELLSSLAEELAPRRDGSS